MKVKAFLHEILPPFVFKGYRALKTQPAQTPVENYGFSGNYSNWEDLNSLCNSGYEDKSLSILTKTREWTLNAKRIANAQPRLLTFRVSRLQSALHVAGLSATNSLCVLDFGGALGATYFLNRPYLKKDINLKWIVVDTPTNVECGEREFKNSELSFVSLLTQLPKNIDLVIASASLPYVEDPQATIAKLVALSPDFLIFDRMPLLKVAKDRLVMQYVHPSIYQAKYPAWLFSQSAFLQQATSDHGLVTLLEWDCPEDVTTIDNGSTVLDYKGWLFKRSKT